MKITWFGHSCFRVETGRSVLLIDLGACCGLVLVTREGKSDTAIFSDMALTNEMHRPQVGFVPIGDRFTMGAKSDCPRLQALLHFRDRVSVSLGTFPVLDQTADKFVAEMGSNIVRVPEPGVPFEL
jgi:L-ascorbate metabolism protein UlaG (beta-lactamase superfamily)